MKPGAVQREHINLLKVGRYLDAKILKRNTGLSLLPRF